MKDIAGFSAPRFRSLGPLLLAVALLPTWGCSGPPNGSADASPAGASAPAPGSVDTSEDRVTALMGELSNYSDKMGWAIEAQNQPLATFYLDKIDRSIERLAKVQRWEGIPIGGMAMATMSGSQKALRSNLERGDWTATGDTYRSMTLACNSCHSATRREYVVILPVTSPPPPGQSFEAP